MTGGATATVSPVIRISKARYEPTSAAVGDIRAQTARTLEDWGVDADAVDVAKTIVSELAANAVRVSREDEFVAVRLATADSAILIEVWDARDKELPQIGHPDDESENGRGLLIVEALSTRLSWYFPKPGGKIVWAKFPFKSRPLPAPMPGDTPLSQRRPEDVPAPHAPVSFISDPETLQRVADALRRLDPWHDTEPAAHSMSG